MKLLYSFLLLFCCFATAANCTEPTNENGIASPEACDQNPKCPRDKHPIGENCPHNPD